jgi:hypothetical protein
LRAFSARHAGGLQFRKLPAEQFAGGLLFAQQAGQFAQTQVEVFDGAVAIAEAGVEFAFAQGEDVGAVLEVLHPLEIVSIPVDKLGALVGSLSDQSQQIVAALDELFTRAWK